jgi:SAM-dependent methyltransferase
MIAASLQARCSNEEQTMDQDKMVCLRNQEFANRFYEDRYAQGYMDEWPLAKKKRIFEVVRGLDLPGHGQALDFGCGNGVFTEVLRQALPPGWRVCGLDLSANAIAHAKKRYPLCQFYLPGNHEFAAEKFDFLFSHHVLEHVSDLDAALSQICLLAKEQAAILHVLPCGNHGSFEYNLCALRRKGIDPALENRYFFEDEGHIRRLNSLELSGRMGDRKFILKKEYYGNQFFGALNWITQSEWCFVRHLSDPAAAVSQRAHQKLKRINRCLTAIKALRFPVQSMERKLRKSRKTGRDAFILLAEAPFYLPSKLVDLAIKYLAQREWRKRKTDRNGSEMYLYFSRV